MAAKKIVMVAHDIVPSQAFLMVSKELSAKSYLAFLGGGKPTDTSLDYMILESIKEAGAVLLGMSSSSGLAREEIAAAKEAMRLGIPFGFFGDTYNCYQRARDDSWFGFCRKEANFFFAINKEEANDASSIFSKAEIIVTGNPLWEEFAFPKFSRQEARKTLGISDHEIFLLSPGGKSPVINILLWGTLLDALDQIKQYGKGNFKVVLACHPGDRTPFAIDPADHKVLEVYDDLLRFGPVPTTVLESSKKISDVLPGADLMVEWGTTACIEAAYLRIPIISLSTAIGRKRLISTSGTEIWEPVLLGISEGVRGGSNKLAHAIMLFLFTTNDAKERQRHRQGLVCPKPSEKGAAVKKMITALKKFLK